MGDWLSLGGLCIFSMVEFFVHFLREQIFTGRSIDFWHLWPLHIPGFRAWFNYPGPSNPVYREWSCPESVYRVAIGLTSEVMELPHKCQKQKIITELGQITPKKSKKFLFQKKVETALHSTSQTNIQGLTFLTFGDVKSFLCWSRYASCTASFAWPWRWMEHLNRWHTRPPGNCVHGKAFKAKVLCCYF